MLRKLLHQARNLLLPEKSSRKSNEKKLLARYQGAPYQSDLRYFAPEFYGGTVEDITGYREEEFREGTITWDRLIHPDDLHLFLQEDEKLKETEGHLFDVEYRIIRKDGEIRWLRDIGQVLPTPGEKAPQISGALYDITDQKQAVENMRRALGISDEDFLDTPFKKE